MLNMLKTKEVSPRKGRPRGLRARGRTAGFSPWLDSGKEQKWRSLEDHGKHGVLWQILPPRVQGGSRPTDAEQFCQEKVRGLSPSENPRAQTQTPNHGRRAPCTWTSSGTRSATSLWLPWWRKSQTPPKASLLPSSPQKPDFPCPPSPFTAPSISFSPKRRTGTKRGWLLHTLGAQAGLLPTQRLSPK